MLLQLLIAYVGFLFPLALYCLVLAGINRRSGPTMVSGVWDFIGLLGGASGFLFISAPTLLSTFYTRNIEFPMDEGARVQPAAVVWGKWAAVWILYYAMVLAGAGYLLWLRRNKTVIYNVDPDLFEGVFTRAVAKLALTQAHLGRSVILGPLEVPGAGETGVQAGLSRFPQRATGERHGQLDIDVFRPMSNITLHWRPDADIVRTEIEAELHRNLDECRALENPSGTWFLGMGMIFFGLIFMVVVFLLLMMYFPPRRW